MSIKPVEIQVNIPRTMEASKSNSDEKQKEAAFSEGQSQNVMQQSNEKLKKVRNKDKVEGLKVKKDQEEKKKKKETKKKKSSVDSTDHVIDVEI